MQRGDDDIHLGDDVAGCPSGMELALLRAGDLHDIRAAWLKQHVARCQDCREHLCQLDAAESELLLPLGGPGVASTAHHVAREAGRRRRVSRTLTVGLPTVATLAAFSAVLIATHAPSTQATDQGAVAISAGPTRVKGAFSAQLFLKRAGEVSVPDGRTTFQAGDRLRFAYTSPRDGFVAVFGVDAEGRVSPYYPAADLRSLAVHAGQQILLPDAIELDADPRDERLFLVFRETPWSDDMLRRPLTFRGANVLADGRLPLPGFEQMSWLLKRR